MKISIGPNDFGLEGEYELDMTFAFGDHRTIKRVSGLRVLEYQEALAAGDVEFIVALASIALTRAGKQHDVEQLFSLPDNALTINLSKEEDASPPPQELERRIEDAKPSSGDSSNGATEHSLENRTLDASGTPQPVSTSDPLTSTT